MARLIKADGTTTEVVPSNGKKFTLTELQTLVGGYIQVLKSTEKQSSLVVDEEGLLRAKPVNLAASQLLHPMYLGQQLRGDVVVATRKEF
jgi:hypothetical protein